jgi:Ca2+-binding RTX toxin-like protein
VALGTGTLVFALTCVVTGPKSVPPFVLTSGTGFNITSTVYPSPACSGTPALLYPGTTRCAVFSVHNNLTVPITVLTVTTALNGSYTAPPAICAGSNLILPTFSGSFTVAGGGSANIPGVPIALKDSGTNQDVCENFTYHLLISGTAQYTDATTTVLASSHNPSNVGKAVTFTATVTANNASSDPSLPTGTVTFYPCLSATSCGSTTSLGTGTIGAGGQATFSTFILPVGTTYVEAVYGGASTNFSGSTSNVITQVVTGSTVATTTALTSSPNPSGPGKPVTLTATVTKSSGSGTPTGTVNFYHCATAACSGAPDSLGSGTLNPSAKATFVTLLLPAGTDSLYAVYSGDTNFETSTSPVITQEVVSLPPRCTGRYTNWFFGNPGFPNITGTNGDDFIYAFGGNYRVHDFNGNDCCFYAGDGNNWLSDGNGNDVALAGDGNNVFTLGNGNDQIVVGNGTNTIGAGNGSDSVTVGNGSHNGVTLGSGTDVVTLGSGSYNGVTLGSGTDMVTIQGGGYDEINGGNGNETIYLGAGTYNNYNGAAHHTNLCHLPAPPSWHGTVAAYYHDTITNCTVVTP